MGVYTTPSARSAAPTGRNAAAWGIAPGTRGFLRRSSSSVGLSWLGRNVWTDDADELIHQVAKLVDGVVNRLGQPHVGCWVLGTGDDATVRLTLAMKPFEIGMIVGKHRTLVGNRIRENLCVTYALASATGLLHRQDVVPQAA